MGLPIFDLQHRIGSESPWQDNSFAEIGGGIVPNGVG